MELGFGLISCQRYPGDPRSWTDLYAEALALCAEAERVGLASVWTSEHHFVDDGYMPSLLPLSAAIAARTSSIRIGTGVLLAPLYHPLRLAEDAATVDLISQGRLILGLGLGWSGIEFEALGAQLGQRGRAMSEILQLLPKAWRGEPLEHQGEVDSFPPVVVRPIPAAPIPVWVGGSAEAAVRRAARWADGLYMNVATPGVADLVRLAHKELEEVGRDPSTFTWAYHIMIYPSDDSEEGWAEVRDHVAYLRWKYSDLQASATRHGAPLPSPPRPDPEHDSRLRQAALVGPPEQLAARLLDLQEAAGVPLHVIARSYLPGLTFERQVEVVQRLGREVLPLLS